MSINPFRAINCWRYVLYSSGQGTVNVPKPLSSLAKRVPRPSNTALLTMHENSPRKVRRKVRGKGHGSRTKAKVRLRRPVTVAVLVRN